MPDRSAYEASVTNRDGLESETAGDAQMIGMVLVTHGRLAAEFIAALEHVVGPQQRIAAVCIGADDDMEQRRRDILDSVA